MKNYFLLNPVKQEQMGSSKSFKVLDIRGKELNWIYSNFD